jgi:hypothetical protein
MVLLKMSLHIPQLPLVDKLLLMKILQLQTVDIQLILIEQLLLKVVEALPMLVEATAIAAQ